MRFPIPGAWRKDYPHYIGQPKYLRCGYALVIVLSFFVFIFSCGYYYEFDTETITEIAVNPKDSSDSSWACESIGKYTGEFEFATETIPTWNLSESTTTAYTDLDNADTFIKTASIMHQNVPSNWTTYMIKTGFGSSYMDYSPDETSSFDIIRGNSPQYTDCIEKTQKQWCSSATVNSSTIIQNIQIYKFTPQITIHDTWGWNSNNRFEEHVSTSALNIMRSNSSDDIFDTGYAGSLQYFGHVSEYFVAVSNKDMSQNINFCDVINDALEADQIYYTIYIRYNDGNAITSFSYPKDIGVCSYPEYCRNITSVDLVVQCEKIEYDYCIINATAQFMKPIDLPLSMEPSDSDPDESQYIFLSSELGLQCEQRWQTLCEQHLDTKGFCDLMYMSPFACVKIESKTAWAIISLAFASASLASTVLIMCVGFIFERLSKPVITTDANENMKMEMAMTHNVQAADDNETYQ